MTADQAILVALTLIDLTLAANLLLIVLFSGYENFVSKFDIDAGARPARLDGQGRFLGPEDEADRLDRRDFGDPSAEAVHGDRRSAIPPPPSARPRLYWLVVIHLTFVVSGVLLALMDWLQARVRQVRGKPDDPYTVHARIDGPLVMIGFGSIGRGVLPLIERHIGFDRSRFTVIEPSGEFAGILRRSWHPPSAGGADAGELRRGAARPVSRRARA